MHKVLLIPSSIAIQQNKKPPSHKEGYYSGDKHLLSRTPFTQRHLSKRTCVSKVFIQAGHATIQVTNLHYHRHHSHKGTYPTALVSQKLSSKLTLRMTSLKSIRATAKSLVCGHTQSAHACICFVTSCSL